MGKIVIRCNHKQLEAINKDFDDANVAAEVSYGIFHKGTTEVKIFYDDTEDCIVEGIVKYRMKNNEKED